MKFPLASRLRRSYIEFVNVNLTIEWRNNVLHLEVPVAWETDERGSGWVTDYCSGDDDLDRLVASEAEAEADRLCRGAREP